MDPVIAFVFIACGPFAHTYRAEMAIESLIRVGKWGGRVYLITDSPECYDLETLRQQCGSDQIYLQTTERFSNRLEIPFGWGQSSNWYIPRIIQSKTRVFSKSVKAKIFDYLPDEVTIAIYADCDSLVSGSEQMDALIDQASDWSKGEGIQMRTRLKSDAAITKETRIHAGFFIAHRELSKFALNAWSEAKQNWESWQENPFDREKYINAVLKLDTEEDKQRMRLFPIPNKFEGFLDFGKEMPLFVHISSGRLKNNDRTKIETYISSLGLNTIPAGAYCPPNHFWWFYKIFMSGYLPYWGSYKIENLWKKFSIQPKK